MAHNGIKYPKGHPAGTSPYHDLGTESNPMAVKVKGSVNLAIEDLKMLADVAQRQYIANVNHSSLTPSVTIHVHGAGEVNTEKVVRAVTHQLTRQMSSKAATTHTSPSLVAAPAR